MSGVPVRKKAPARTQAKRGMSSYIIILVHQNSPLSISVQVDPGSQPVTFEFVHETPYAKTNHTGTITPHTAQPEEPSEARQTDLSNSTLSQVASTYTHQPSQHIQYNSVHAPPNGSSGWQHLPWLEDPGYTYASGLAQASVNAQITSTQPYVNFMDFRTGLTPEPNVEDPTSSVVLNPHKTSMLQHSDSYGALAVCPIVLFYM
jgi:hypothetical protein